ncbi:MAG: hypothetical protein GVY18_17725 [Bacteroidetes bacterium]|jgi:uncharacterized protein YjiK|nr:hypothetical protein [Bacteroidota bacterium]
MRFSRSPSSRSCQPIPAWLGPCLFAALLLTACASSPESSDTASPRTGPYAFDQPEAAFVLDAELDEISGLTLLADGRLAAVQDEDGTIYVLDPSTGAIDAEIDFGGDGDYEGIERVDDELWVLRSDGTLFEVNDWDGDPDVEKHRTALGAAHDTEGLAYDPERNRLLIACKEYPGDGLKGQRAIYAFDVAEEALLPEPIALIDRKAVGKDLQEHPANRAVRQLLSPVAEAGGFKPSALARHPGTQELYVLSSVWKVVVVLGADGSVQAVWPLPERYVQPEGLAILLDGTLFIANEGAGGAPTLFKIAAQGDS